MSAGDKGVRPSDGTDAGAMPVFATERRVMGLPVSRWPAIIAPIVIGDQIKAGTPQFAMYGFAVFYAVCLVLNWWFYLRAHAYVKNP